MGFGLRVWELGVNSIWFDEAMEVLTATSKPTQLLGTVASHLQDPPLFTVLLKSWLLFGNQEYFLRFLPLAFSLVAVAIVAKTAERL